MKNPAGLISSRHRQHILWLQESGAWSEESYARDFEEDIELEGFGNLRNLAMSLMGLTLRSAHLVVTDSCNLQAHLDRCLIYQGLSVQIAISVYLREFFLSRITDVPIAAEELDRLPLLIALAGYRGLPKLRRQLVLLQRELLKIANKSVVLKQRFDASGPFRFIFELESKIDGFVSPSDVDDPKVAMGPYWDLLHSECSSDVFLKSMVRCADYRMTLLESRNGSWAPLDIVPFDLMPVELLYLIEVCKRNGSGVPEITHPLLSPWRQQVFSSPSLAIDERIQRVLTKCAACGIYLVLDGEG